MSNTTSIMFVLTILHYALFYHYAAVKAVKNCLLSLCAILVAQFE